MDAPQLTPAPESRSPWTLAPTLALAAVIVAAIALRVWSFTHRTGSLWFEEDIPVVWASGMWRSGHLDLDPHNGHWPHLSAYVFLLFQGIHALAGLALGHYRALAEFRIAAMADPDLLRTGGMLGAIAIGVASMIATARLVARMSTVWLGVAVAALLAIDPLHLRYSLVPSPDLLQTLWVTLALMALLDVSRRDRAFDSARAGLYTGLGVATKFLPGILGLAALLAHTLAPTPDGRPRARRATRLGVYALATLVATFATSPFTWLDLARHGGELRTESGAFWGGAFGSDHVPAALRYTVDVLPADLGWPLAIVALGLFAWSVLRPTRARSILLAYALPYAFLLAFAGREFPRYLLPLGPVVAALAASVVVERVRTPWARRLAWATAAVAIAGLASASIGYAREIAAVDSRAAARAWIAENVPDGALLALEQLGPEPPDLETLDLLAGTPGLSARGRARLARRPAYEIYRIPMSVHDPDATQAFYRLPDYLDFDCIVTSSGVRGRFAAERPRFPIEREFYAGLDRFARLRYSSRTADRIGPEIRVYALDSTKVDSIRAWWDARMALLPRPSRFPFAEYLASEDADRATHLARRGKFDAAVHAWDRALMWVGAPPKWSYLAGMAYAADGHFGAARVATRRAYERDPRLREAGFAWAELATQTGAWEEAREAYIALLEQGPLSSEARQRADALRELIDSHAATTDSAAGPVRRGRRRLRKMRRRPCVRSANALPFAGRARSRRSRRPPEFSHGA